MTYFVACVWLRHGHFWLNMTKHNRPAHFWLSLTQTCPFIPSHNALHYWRNVTWTSVELELLVLMQRQTLIFFKTDLLKSSGVSVLLATLLLGENRLRGGCRAWSLFVNLRRCHAFLVYFTFTRSDDRGIAAAAPRKTRNGTMRGA